MPEDQHQMKWQIPSTQSYEWIDYAQTAHKITLPLPIQGGMVVDSGISSDEGGVILSHKSYSNTRFIHNLNNLWERILQYELSEYIDWDMKKKLVV